MTQAAVAEYVGIARSAVTEIETGRRRVSGLELHRLAYLYGRDVEELLTEDFVESEPITALFRRHQESTVDEATLEALRRCVVLGREVANLEGLLGNRPCIARCAHLTPFPRRPRNGKRCVKAPGPQRTNAAGWTSAKLRFPTWRNFLRIKVSSLRRNASRRTFRG